jgi:phage-related protein
MLDNLKLGYGGTRAEMERLIADANEYAISIGEAGDMAIENYGDIVRAIDLIQQKQGIAGTTAKEAASTISGSLMMVKAAW